MAERKGQPVSQRRSKLVENLLANQLASSGQPAYSPLEVAGRLAMVYALNKEAGQNTAAEQAQMQSLVDVLAPQQAAQFGADTPELPGRPETTDVPTPTPEAMQAGMAEAGQGNQLRDILMGLGQQNPEMVQGLMGSMLQQRLVSDPAAQRKAEDDMRNFMFQEGIRQQGRMDLAAFRAGLSAQEQRDLRERKISDYMDIWGMDRREAVLHVDKIIQSTTSPDALGNLYTTNPIDGTATRLSARGDSGTDVPMPSSRRIDATREAGIQDAESGQALESFGAPWRRPVSQVTPAPNIAVSVITGEQERVQGVDLALSQADRISEDVIAKGTGSASAYKRALSSAWNIIPWGGAVFTDEAEAAAVIRQFNQVAKGALTNNPRAPVAEQGMIDKFLPNPNAITTNPETELLRFSSIYQMLEQTRENSLAFIEGRQPTQVPRRRTGMRSDPIVDLPPDVTDEQILDTLPPGTYFVDPRDGKLKVAQ